MTYTGILIFSFAGAFLGAWLALVLADRQRGQRGRQEPHITATASLSTGTAAAGGDTKSHIFPLWGEPAKQQPHPGITTAATPDDQAKISTWLYGEPPRPRPEAE